MLIWGYDTFEAFLPSDAADACPKCAKVQPHRVRVEWQVAHAFLGFRGVSKETWFAQCTDCGSERPLPKDLVKRMKKMPRGDPVPFWDRHSSEIAIGVPVAIVLVITFYDVARAWLAK